MDRDRARPLAGEVAVVTGGGRGIGRATALALAREGAAVAVVARSRAEIEAVAAEVARAGGHAAAIPCDVTDEGAIRAMAAGVRSTLGPATIVVNNAGIAESAPFLKTSLEMWQRIFRVNVESALLVTQAFLPAMLERGRGRIVNVASIAARRGMPYIAAYCASKHALLGLTRALAAEVAKKGVTVNAVCPGYVDTSMTDRSVEVMKRKTGKSEEELRSVLAHLSPQERLFRPEEVAEVAVRLCTDLWGGVTGQAICLDGGETQA